MAALAIRDPTSDTNDSLMVMKFWLIADGIFIWEFITTLYYEWNFIRGRQPYRWAIWIYFLARWSTLAVVVLDLVSFNTTSEINCQVWVKFIWTFGVLGLGSASLLIMLRIFAIWNMHKLIMAFSIALWLTEVSLLLLSMVQINTVWVPLKKSCAVTNIENCKVSLIFLLVTDVTLLLIMLVGLLRIRRRGGGSLDLGRLLWKQGCIWFAIATAAELPQMILVTVHVNDIIKLMFVVPAMITMTVGATRMYRSLSNFGSPSSTNVAQQDSENTHRRSRLVSHSKHSSTVHKLSKQLEVTVHTDYEEHPMSQSRETHYDEYSPGSDRQKVDKPDEFSMDGKVQGHEVKARQAVIDIAGPLAV